VKCYHKHWKDLSAEQHYNIESAIISGFAYATGGLAWKVLPVGLPRRNIRGARK